MSNDKRVVERLLILILIPLSIDVSREYTIPSSPNPQSSIHNRQSAIRNPQSSIRNPQSAIVNPQSAIRQSAIDDPQSAIRLANLVENGGGAAARQRLREAAAEC
jgi:hypothetical protein